MNSQEVKNIYRIWQDRLRKENKNEGGENQTVALPTNDAANAELKRMLIECGISNDEATELVYKKIPRIFNLLEGDDDKYQSVGYGKYKLKTDIGPDGKGKKGTPTFTKDDAGNYVETGEDDDKKDDSPKLKQQTNQNYAEDGEEPKPGQSTIDGDHLTSPKSKDDKEQEPEGTPLKKPLSSKTVDKHTDYISKSREIAKNEQNEDIKKAMGVLNDNWENFTNAKTEEQRLEAV